MSVMISMAILSPTATAAPDTSSLVGVGTQVSGVQGATSSHRPGNRHTPWG
jgi:hypothetical protein